MPVLAMFMTANRAILAHSGIYLRFLTSEDTLGETEATIPRRRPATDQPPSAGAVKHGRRPPRSIAQRA